MSVGEARANALKQCAGSCRRVLSCKVMKRFDCSTKTITTTKTKINAPGLLSNWYAPCIFATVQDTTCNWRLHLVGNRL